MKAARTISTALLLSAALAVSPFARAEEPPDFGEQVSRALGRPGAMLPGGVYRIGFPRTDLNVTLGGTGIRPALALGSWAAFKRTGGGDETIVMGDLVLLGPEVSPVMKKLLNTGFDVTALHNHLVGESPRLMYLHYEGRGPAAMLAQRLRDALSPSATPLGPSSPAAPPPPLTDAQKKSFGEIQEILGHEGKIVGDVLQVGIPRSEPVTCRGVEIPPAMGTATALNFQPAGSGVATTGDFVLTDDELAPVLRTLTSGGIEVEAVHSHMVHETPTLKFVHFWAQGPAPAIARTLRSALDHTAVSK